MTGHLASRSRLAHHLIVFNAEHLRRILSKYARYYNEVRTHVSLGKDAPYTRSIERYGNIIGHPISWRATPSIRADLVSEATTINISERKGQPPKP